jgi:hypothetical protein
VGSARRWSREEERVVTTVVGWYAIVVGGLMIGWWAVELRGGALQRPDRSPSEVGLHLLAELLTAGLLVAGGIVLLAGGASSVALIALGMLLYTVIQSPGYFLSRREHPPVVMFGVLAVLTVAALLILTA